MRSVGPVQELRWISSFKLHIYVLLLCASIVACEDRVRLEDVTTLTLVKGQMTAGRRSAPVPQLQCIGGSAKGRYEPRVVQCYNRGFDGISLQWECKTEMSSEYIFGRIEVSCEGYSYPEDPFILKGSCGLKYELDYAGGGAQQKKQPSAPPYEGEETSTHSILFWIVVIFVIAMFVFALIPSPASRAGHRDGSSRDGWDGGPPPPPGFGGGPAQPPPYGFKTDGQRPSNAPPTYDEACGGGTRSGTHSTGSSADSGPGFFSGLGLGGLAGYMFGRNQDSGYGAFRRRFRGSQFERDTGFYDDDRPSTSGLRQRSSSPSTRTTSGFGGTSRR